MQNLTPSLTSFLRYCENVANLLLWVLWKCFITPINNDSITLWENLMPKVLRSTDAQSIKINILWACVAMHTQNDTINLLKTFVFIWRQKFMLILHGPFFQKFGQNEFFWKNGFCRFLNIQIIYHHAKNEKKLITDSWEKCRTDGQTNRQEDRQRDRRPNGQTNNGDFIGPCERRGSKKKERQN